MGIFLQKAYENSVCPSKVENHKISIIIPVYKTAKYLTKCINSILKQGIENVEIILIPNGDDNEDHATCDKYAKENSQIKVIHNTQKGPGGARNAGIEIATGDYIWFIDSDDWIEEGSIKKIFNLLKYDYDLIVFEANTPAEKGAKKQKGIKKYLKNRFEGEKFIDKVLIFATSVCVWNKIFKRTLIDKFQIRFTEKGVLEDYPFFYHYCAVAEKAYFLNEKLYNYLQRSSSTMAKNFEHDYEYIKQHITSLEFLHKQLSNTLDNFEEYFAEIFTIIISAGLRYCNNKDKIKFLEYAYETYQKLQMTNFGQIDLIQLENKEYYKIINKIKSERTIKLLHIIPIKIVEGKKGKTKYYLFNKILLFIVERQQM